MSAFVSVGNATQPFRRLLDAVDHLARSGVLTGPVLVQRGNTLFESAYVETADFIPMEEFSRHILESDILILQAGAGSIITALANGRMPVIVPRRPECGEIVDHHQLTLARRLETAGRVIAAYEVGDLPSCILRAREHDRREKAENRPARIIEHLKRDLQQLVSAQ